MIDRNNYQQILKEYACDKYEDKLTEFHEKFWDEFPYKFEGLSKKSYMKNFMDWLIFEKKLPHNNKTIVEEYIDDHPELDQSTKENLLGTRECIVSEFIVISKNGVNMKIKDRKTSKVYLAMFQVVIPSVGVNTILDGRIHHFGSVYFFAGAFGVYNSPMILDSSIMMNMYEEKMIADAEKLLLSNSSKLSAILNKYPSQWVDGICSELSLSTKGKKNIKAQMIPEKIKKDLDLIIAKLSPKAKDVLRIVLKNEGYIPYAKLKDFDDDMSFWWVEHAPTSTIGSLRAKGLLVVGKRANNGRMHKIAFIPEELREEIAKRLRENTTFNDWKEG